MRGSYDAGCRADLLDVDVFVRFFIRIEHRPSGLQIDLLSPIRRRIEFVGSQKLAVVAVQHVSEAVAIEVRHRRDGLAIDDAVAEPAFIDAIIIPFVMRRPLISPRRDTGIGIAREYRRRPLVVTRPLRGIPFQDCRCRNTPGSAADRRWTIPTWCRLRVSTRRRVTSSNWNSVRPAARGAVDRFLGIYKSILVAANVVRPPRLFAGRSAEIRATF